MQLPDPPDRDQIMFPTNQMRIYSFTYLAEALNVVEVLNVQSGVTVSDETLQPLPADNAASNTSKNIYYIWTQSIHPAIMFPTKHVCCRSLVVQKLNSLETGWNVDLKTLEEEK